MTSVVLFFVIYTLIFVCSEEDLSQRCVETPERFARPDGEILFLGYETYEDCTNDVGCSYGFRKAETRCSRCVTKNGLIFEDRSFIFTTDSSDDRRRMDCSMGSCYTVDEIENNGCSVPAYTISADCKQLPSDQIRSGYNSPDNSEVVYAPKDLYYRIEGCGSLGTGSIIFIAGLSVGVVGLCCCVFLYYLIPISIILLSIPCCMMCCCELQV